MSDKKTLVAFHVEDRFISPVGHIEPELVEQWKDPDYVEALKYVHKMEDQYRSEEVSNGETPSEGVPVLHRGEVLDEETGPGDLYVGIDPGVDTNAVAIYEGKADGTLIIKGYYDLEPAVHVEPTEEDDELNSIIDKTQVIGVIKEDDD